MGGGRRRASMTTTRKHTMTAPLQKRKQARSRISGRHAALRRSPVSKRALQERRIVHNGVPTKASPRAKDAALLARHVLHWHRNHGSAPIHAALALTVLSLKIPGPMEAAGSLPAPRRAWESKHRGLSLTGVSSRSKCAPIARTNAPRRFGPSCESLV